ncbi:MAG: 2-hydroxyacyl-CoA dehydratase family protein [Maritimibacter sp.]
MTPLAQLERAFALRAQDVSCEGQPLVGLFGDGLPEALIAGAGARCVEVKAPPLGCQMMSDVVREIAEPFLDVFAARFLHRFATGAFDAYALIIFARDDVAGLTAYQYACELRRLGHVSNRGPKLHLWNLLHQESTAAQAFNQLEYDRLIPALEAATGQAFDSTRIAKAQADEALRAGAIDRLKAHPDIFVLRNAGRWLSAQTHAALLDQIPAAKPPQHPRRIGLIGTACDTPVLHGLAAEFGTLQRDLTPYGDLWPGCHAGPQALPELLHAVASQPIHIRTNPPERFDRALDDALAPCDLIIASVDANDDSFGWEVPGLKARATARGQSFVSLAFRPHSPDAAWIDAARSAIKAALT